jgi:hypothetical protein
MTLGAVVAVTAKDARGDESLSRGGARSKAEMTEGNCGAEARSGKAAEAA